MLPWDFPLSGSATERLGQASARRSPYVLRGMQQRQLQHRRHPKVSIGTRLATSPPSISEPTKARQSYPHRVPVPACSSALETATIVAYGFTSQAVDRFRPVQS
jgi:hypothetical protein